MASEKIEVEMITTVAGALQAVEKLNARLDRQEKQLQKIGDTSAKAANSAVNSFNKLEQELKENEAALRRMAMGTKEFDVQRQKVDALRKSLANAKGELSKIGGGIGTSLANGVKSIAAMYSGMLSFQTVVSAVVSELEKTSRLKLEAAATTRTFEQALADVGQNIGAEAVPEAKEMILEQAPKLGTTQEGLANLLGIAISAGAKDIQEAMSLSTAALKLTVGDATKAAALVGGTLDVASLGGSKNFEGALGQLLQTQSQVRSTNLAEFAANIGPGLAAATSQGQHQEGVTTERALEIASTISQIIKDPTGSNTATTMRQFFTRLDSFAPERAKELDDGGVAKVSKDAIAAFKGAKTFDERLAMLRENEGMMLQFLETQRESIGKTAVREIIGGSDRAVAFEKKAAEAIQSIDDAQGFFANLSDVINAETAQLKASRKAEANIAASQVRGDLDLAGTVKEIVDKAIDSVDLSGMDTVNAFALRRRMNVESAIGSDPIESGIAVLTAAQQQQRAVVGVGNVGGTIPVGGQVSNEHRALLQEQIKALHEMRDELARQRQAAPAAKPARPDPAPARPREAPLPVRTVP